MPAVKSSYLAAADVERLLAPGREGWAGLNADIMALPPEALRELLEAEVVGRRRQEVIRRIYGRYHRLRAREELASLLNGRVPWTSRS